MAFVFEPATFIPFRDTAAIARVIGIKRQEITRHPNPDFRIRVIPDAEIERLIDHAYDLVRSKLTKAVKATLPPP